MSWTDLVRNQVLYGVNKRERMLIALVSSCVGTSF